MMKSLQKKFIRITMLAVTAVMLVLCLSVNIANYVSTQSDLNGTLDMIAENRGTIPKALPEDTAQEPASGENENTPPALPDAPNENKEAVPEKPTGPFTEETPYSTRYFVLRYDDEGVLSDAGLDNIASITEDDVPEYLSFAVSQGEGDGYYNGYQYKISRVGEDRFMAVFLDCYQQRRSVYTLALLSLAVTAVCILLVYVIVLLCSKKAIEPMLKNAQRQKQFITDASHELKTPITVIATSLTVLEMEVGRQKWIDKAMAQTEKLKALVNSLVTLARMDEEDSPLQLSSFAAGSAVRETAESFVDFAESEGLSLKLDIDDTLSYVGDEYAVRQLVSILLDNAVKYAVPDSEIIFCLKKSELSAKGICIQTANHCEALETDKLDKLFDRFYRSDESRQSSGFGIGLSIARSIAEGHHGRITATSPSDDVIVFTADLK